MTTIKQWAMKRLKQVSSKSWVLLNHIVFPRHARISLNEHHRLVNNKHRDQREKEVFREIFSTFAVS